MISQPEPSRPAGACRSFPSLVAACLLGLLIPGGATAAVQAEPLLRMRVEGRYDSNLAEGGSDGTGLLQPSVGLRLRAPTWTASGLYTFEHLRYADEGEGRGGSNHRVAGVQRVDLSRRTGLALRQDFEHAYDPTSLSRAGVVRAVGASTYLAGEAELAHRLSPRWTLGLSLREELALLEAESAVDGAVHSPGASLTYALSRLDTFRIDYRFQAFDAFGEGTSLANEGRLRYERRLTVFSHFGIEAGPALYRNGGVETWIPVGAADLSFRRRGVAFTLRYDRGLTGATGFPGALWADAISATAGWRISRPLRLSLGAVAFRNGEAPAESSFVEGLAGAAVLDYALNEQFSVQGVWRRVAQSGYRSSDFDFTDIDRNIVAIGLTWRLDAAPR